MRLAVSAALIAAGASVGLHWRSAAAAQSDPGARASLDITVKTDGSGGAAMIALYADAESYGGDGEPARAVRVEISEKVQTVSFDDLQPGDYAIRSYHDRNGDGELNANPFGLPTEPFAFSNGARPSFGPPGWDAARIELKAGDNAETLDFDA